MSKKNGKPKPSAKVGQTHQNLRLPFELHNTIYILAAMKGVRMTVFVRQVVDSLLAELTETDAQFIRESAKSAAEERLLDE